MSLTRGQRPGISRVHTQVPVTALAFHGQHLLAAQDTTLCIYDIESGLLVAQRSPRALASVNSGQPIHGINVHPVTGAILLWGASAVAYLPEGWEGKAEISGKATDWIYAGALSPYEAGDQSWQGLGVVVTAHNDLVPLIADEAIGRLVFGHAISPSRPILYSATSSFLTPNTLLVVGGTVFGEIIVWRCRLDSAEDSSSGAEPQAEILYTLVGHEGSIFGVTISQPLDNGRRILASCSDDRTIRLWDITDSNPDGTIPEGGTGAARETGFNTPSSASPKPIATAMGHSSRIWGVRLVAAEDDPSSTVVYSFGEDATMQRWGVDLQAGKLSHENTFALNDGKHLWAHALLTRSNGSLLFATGGADSRISLIEEPAPMKTSDRSSLVTIDIKDVLKDAPSIANAPKRAKEIITRYDFLSADELVAMTSSGRILRGAVAANASEWRIVPVENEKHAEDLSLCYALRAIAPGVVALGTTSGNVYTYDMNKGLSLVTSLDGRIMDLVLVESSLDSTVSIVDVYVQLQGNKYPCYLTINPSDSTLHSKADLTELDDRFVAVSALKARGYVFIGSRHGYLSILKPQILEDGPTTYPVIYTLPPRAPDAISCIVEIPSDNTSSANPPLYIMTTSRDGYYRIYHLHDRPSTEVSLELLHETPAPFGPILTGAYFTTPAFPSASPELILHGFRGKDFLIYNETKRSELASIHCGGAHRMHCLWTAPSSASDTARLRFAFTRTSLISIYAQETVSHRSLTPGTHGREVRAMSSNEIYLATGSEDTTIRIWSIEELDNQPHHLMTMKAHNTGIQQLRWLGCSHLLSSGGFEEFFIWRVRRLKGSLYNGVAVMREAKLEDTTGDTDGDLRIMDFDACGSAQSTCEKEQKMVITMVLSDSTVKTYSYSQSGGFVLLTKGRYTGACITQIRHLTPGAVEEMQLVTGSTDGHLCIWKSDASTATYQISSSKKLHQNTIKAMDIYKTKDGSSGHTNNFLVLTGGDDNAIYLSQIHSSASSEDPKTTAYSIIQESSFPRAHTASINGIAILPPSETACASCGYTGVSTSNDQRVKLWDLGHSGQNLALLEDRYSGVADPGDLEVLHGDRGTLITGGVGMEVWQVNGQDHEQ
ncbi:WD40 repeat-like protein [Sarocladium strictum]